MVALFRIVAWIIAISYRLIYGTRSLFFDISEQSEWKPPSVSGEGFQPSHKTLRIIGFVLIVFSPLFLLTPSEALQGVGVLGIFFALMILAYEFGGGADQDKSEVRTLPPDDNYPTVIYSILISQTTKWQPEQALQLLEQITLALPQIVLRISADTDGVRWQIVDMGWGIVPTAIEQMIRTVHPQAEIKIEVIEPAKPVEEPFLRYITYYRLPNMFVAPLPHVSDLREVDPLTSLTEIMSDLDTGERVTYVVIINGLAPEAYEQGEKLITQSTIHPLQYLSQRGIADAINQKLSGFDRMRKFERRDQQVFEDKLRQKLVYALVMLEVDAPSPERVQYLVGMCDTQLCQFSRMPYNALRWVERPLDQYAVVIEEGEQADIDSALGVYRAMLKGEIPAKQQPPQLIVEPRELAALWHLPHEGFNAFGIEWATPGQVALPARLKSDQQGILLGFGQSRGKTSAVYLSDEDRRTHTNIIGKTGTGKSTLMHHLIHQDIRNGEGVAVIDPHGTLIRDILQCSIPIDRLEDVVVLDLADQDNPPPINPMRGQGGFANTGRIVDIIESLFEGTEQYVRLAKYLRAAVELLKGDPHATMRDISRVFTDVAYRYDLLNGSDNPFVEDVWDTFDRQSLAQQRQIHEPVLSRIAPFYGNPILYPMLCHPDSLDFKTWIEERKIILISLALPDDLVPEQERNLVGSLIVAMLQRAGMREVSNPFYVYIDEVQRFVTTPLNVMLSEARKFGLSLTIANQYLGQLAEGNTLEAVMGNVGTTLAFRCSPTDARAIASYMRPEFMADTLTNLHRFQVAVKLQHKGMTLPAFTLWSQPPIERSDNPAFTEFLIRVGSSNRYTPKTRQDVLAWLSERYPQRKRQVENDEATFYDKGDGGHDQTAAD